MPEQPQVQAPAPGNGASRPATSTPIRICVLGSEAAGKTCFLGGLAILSEPNRDSHIHVIGAEIDTATTNGSPSQQFLNEVAATLRAGDWPPPTTLTREVELDIRFRDRVFRFDVIDYPGESFREALNQLDENRQKALIDHMLRADFLLLMLDPEADLPDEDDLDPEARQRVHERQNAHVAGIRKIYDDAQVSGRSLPHIGLVITKADSHPSLASPENFIGARGANLLARIKSWGVETACFATTAVGSTENGRPPRELSPRGYTEIFDWVVATTMRGRRGRLVRRVLMPIAFTLFAITLLLYLQGNRARQIAGDRGRPLETRVHSANRALVATPALKETIDELAAEQLGDMRERFTNLQSAEELGQLTSDFKLLKSLRRSSRAHEIAEFGRLLEEGDRKLRLRRIRLMATGDPELLEIAQAFMKDYPAAAEAEEIERIIANIRDLHDETDREKVRRVSLQQGDLDSLNRKADAIMEYVIAHPTHPDREEMERAAAVARKLASTNPLKVRISAAGSFLKARKWELRIYIDDLEEPLATYPSDGKTKRATWDRLLKVTNWKPGTTIRMEVEDFRLINEMVAESEAADLLSIKSLAHNAMLPIRDDFGSQYIDGSFFRVITIIDDFTRDDWKLLELYVHPGSKW